VTADKARFVIPGCLGQVRPDCAVDIGLMRFRVARNRSGRPRFDHMWLTTLPQLCGHRLAGRLVPHPTALLKVRIAEAC